MQPLVKEQVRQLEHGDKLVCISMENHYTGKPEVGKEYTVSSVSNSHWVGIKETNNNYEYFCFSFPKTPKQSELPTKYTTKIVTSHDIHSFEKEVDTLKEVGYCVLPETFLVNDRRYTILMQLNKPKEL